MSGCTIDWSFLTDDCRPDNGELRTKLEELCDLATDPVIPTDPNAGICGEWGADSTIDTVTYNSGTRELIIGAQPAWGGGEINQVNTVTLAPLNIDAVGTYPNGATITINFTNPSACRQMLIHGTIFANDVVTYGPNQSHSIEVRDITAGAPGVVVVDKLMQLGAIVDFIKMESFVVTPYRVVLAPGASFTQTLQTYVQTTGAGVGPPSEWHQSILHLLAMGILL